MNVLRNSQPRGAHILPVYQQAAYYCFIVTLYEKETNKTNNTKIKRAYRQNKTHFKTQ